MPVIVSTEVLAYEKSLPPPPTAEEMPLNYVPCAMWVRTSYRRFPVYTLIDITRLPLLEVAFAQGWGWYVCYERTTCRWRAELCKRVNGRTLHKQVANLWLPDAKEIDHVQPLTPLDNRDANVRDANSAENKRNRRVQSNNTSGFPGIGRDERSPNRPWHVAIKDRNGRKINRYLPDLLQAIYARDDIARAEHGSVFGRFIVPRLGERCAYTGEVNETNPCMIPAIVAEKYAAALVRWPS